MTIIEKWKRVVNGGAFDVLITDSLKAYDCLSHELLDFSLKI